MGSVACVFWNGLCANPAKVALVVWCMFGSEVLPEPENSWLVLWRLFGYMFCFHPPFLAGNCRVFVGAPGFALIPSSLPGVCAMCSPTGCALAPPIMAGARGAGAGLRISA